MAKIYGKFGVMGSGKSLDMIRAIYNYKERGMDVLVFKPSIDTREGSECVIKSRTGFEVKAEWIESNDSALEVIDEKLKQSGSGNIPGPDYILRPYEKTRAKAIFIDEVQFLSKEQVDNLQKICYNYNIPVICYGLKLDFQSNLFEGSKRLIELADDIQELIGICHCGKRAKQNARVVNGVMVSDGDVVQIGGNESYIAVCNECYYNKNIK